MSPAVTKLRIDTPRVYPARISASLRPATLASAAITRSMRGPSTEPGQIALTRTPNGPSSMASVLVSPTIAHLAAT
jgi:hypothetical protein